MRYSRPRSKSNLLSSTTLLAEYTSKGSGRVSVSFGASGQLFAACSQLAATNCAATFDLRFRRTFLHFVSFAADFSASTSNKVNWERREDREDIDLRKDWREGESYKRRNFQDDFIDSLIFRTRSVWTRRKILRF